MMNARKTPNALIWTLEVDTAPIFAIVPDDQSAVRSYDLLTEFLFDQYFDPDEEKNETGTRDAKSESRLYRVAIAGRIDGTASLYNGTIVPVIRPVTRGMFNWDADTLLEAVLGEKPWTEEQEKKPARSETSCDGSITICATSGRPHKSAR